MRSWSFAAVTASVQEEAAVFAALDGVEQLAASLSAQATALGMDHVSVVEWAAFVIQGTLAKFVRRERVQGGGTAQDTVHV